MRNVEISVETFVQMWKILSRCANKMFAVRNQNERSSFSLRLRVLFGSWRVLLLCRSRDDVLTSAPAHHGVVLRDATETLRIVWVAGGGCVARFDPTPCLR